MEAGAPVSATVANENVRKCVNPWFTHFFLAQQHPFYIPIFRVAPS